MIVKIKLPIEFYWFIDISNLYYLPVLVKTLKKLVKSIPNKETIVHYNQDICDCECHVICKSHSFSPLHVVLIAIHCLPKI